MAFISREELVDYICEKKRQIAKAEAELSVAQDFIAIIDSREQAETECEEFTEQEIQATEQTI